MGDIHGMKHGITLAELAEKSGGKYDTFYRKAKREFPAEIWTADSVLLPEHIAVLRPRKSGGSARKKSTFNPQRQSTPPAPENPETAPARTFFDRLKSITSAQIRTALFNILAVGVVVGHGVLIWVECSQLWGMVGAIGGGVVFTVVLLAVLLASDPSKNRTSAYALWFMACVDTAAFWVHYPSFKTYSVSDAVTVGVCVFICACSFIALVLFQDSKLS